MENTCFQFLDTKPCRIMWKSPQTVSLGTEKYEIEPKLGTWTCPSCPKAPSEGEIIKKNKISSIYILTTLIILN